MSRPDHWMPLYVADYHRDTQHLTTAEHGAYLLLIMACWNGGGVLSTDEKQLRAITRTTKSEWQKLAPSLWPFFIVEGTSMVHRRVLAEHQKAVRFQDKQVANGKLGGRPRKPSQSQPKGLGFESTAA